MPFINELLQYTNDIFIETGTYKGETLDIVLNMYKEIHSIELSDTFYNNCKTKYMQCPKIHLHKGNSKYDLYNIIEYINTPITFWLDSHWSNVDNVGCDAETHCPILYELEQIQRHSIKNHTIMIDDIRLMDNDHFKVTVAEIEKKLYDINPNYTLTYYNDYCAQNDILVAHIMEQYKYTKTWFVNSEVNKFILNYINGYTKNTILEIGCYEGLSSVFFADNLLHHQESSLTCVDPFLQIDTNDHVQFLQNNEEKNFDHNITICKNANKISVNKVTSDTFFQTNTKKFNFIYIDGSHEHDFITRDMENSFAVLEKNGIMWMDDYGGGDGIQIKNTMDMFLEKYKGQYMIINSAYQLAIKKL